MTTLSERPVLDIVSDRNAFAAHQEKNLSAGVIEDMQRKINEAGVEYIYYMLPTIGSRVIAKMVPANHFKRNLEKGIAFHRTALADLQTDRFGNLIGGGIEAKEFVGLPDPETFAPLPWDTSVARVFCSAYEPPHLNEVGGRPLATDSRSLLKRAHAAFTERTGMEVRSGCEPEMTWTGPGMEVIKKPGSSPAYQVENLERMREVYKKLVTYSKALGLDMIEGDYEDDGQLELNWMYDRVELTADRLVTYRQICKQVARELGVHASFMPKPYTGSMGNGCHHNISLWKGDTNLLIDEGRVELHLSDIGRYAVGGMLEHAAGSMSIMASTVNSYKRFWDAGQFAPSAVNWGLDSRACMVRISSNGRMEYRLPDASVNPYLSHTLLIAAMEDGINKQTDPGKPLDDQVRGSAEPKFKPLPLTLGGAIDSLSADPYILNALPEQLGDIYTALKNDEWARYCGAVTDWDRAMYWETLP
ncbi:glutamine synthetase [Arthrobacter sp. SIMBA_036]|uniref:glutamine synthetase family protein n=1 Tax=Arthrobacter sp. SIMBA_036 TaxID=3085778 RepID=UPI00397801B8